MSAGRVVVVVGGSLFISPGWSVKCSAHQEELVMVEKAIPGEDAAAEQQQQLFSQATSDMGKWPRIVPGDVQVGY